MKKEKLFNSGKSFEEFIVSVLREKIQASNILFEYRINDNIFDIYVQDGFDGINSDVAFELKYNITSKKIEDDLKKFKSKIKAASTKSKIVGVFVIFNNNYEIPFKEFNDINIWDYNKIKELIKEYPILYVNSLEKDRLYNNINLEEINYDDVEKHNDNILSRIDFEKDLDKYALVLGAGISVDPGAESWDNLLYNFYLELLNRNILDNKYSKLLDKIGNTNLINAQLYKELLTEKSYYKKIYKGLYDNKKGFSSNFLIYSVSKLIDKNKLKRNFKVITYNYDNYLERYLNKYFSVKYTPIYNNEILLLDDSVPIYHVHGYLPYSKKFDETINNKKYTETIKLTEDDYNFLYNNSYCWQINIQLSLFRENVCLFIGCSLTDPNIRRLLRIIKLENSNNSNKKHFAILTKEDLNLKELLIVTNHFYKMGVEIIWVDDFKGVKKIVEQLLDSRN